MKTMTFIIDKFVPYSNPRFEFSADKIFYEEYGHYEGSECVVTWWLYDLIDGLDEEDQADMGNWNWDACPYRIQFNDDSHGDFEFYCEEE